MTKFTLTLDGDYIVSKGSRSEDWKAVCTIPLAKLPESIIEDLALHGLKQKIADSASQSKTKAEAQSAMESALEALMAGEWTTRRASDGADEWTITARSIIRAMIKAQLGKDSPEWQSFLALNDRDQLAKLDENIEANREAITPAVDAKIEEKRKARDAAKSAKSKVTISL